MLVEPRSGEAVFNRTHLNVQNLERAIQTEIQVLGGQPVRERVQSDLGLPITCHRMSRPARWGRPTSSRCVCGARTPRLAQQLADAYIQRLHLDPPGAGAARPAGRPGPARDQDRRAAGPDRCRGERSAGRSRCPTGHVQGTTGPTADRGSADDGRGLGRAVGDLPTDLRSSRRRCAPPCWRGPSDCSSGSAAAFLLDYIDNSVKSHEDLEGSDGRAGAGRRAGRATAGQPADRAQRAARVRGRDLSRAAHEHPVPRPRSADAGHPGHELAAGRGQDHHRDQPGRRARSGRAHGRPRRRRPPQASRPRGVPRAPNPGPDRGDPRRACGHGRQPPRRRSPRRCRW